MSDSEFGFKGLRVWQEAIEFANSVIEVTENLDSSARHYRLSEQAEAACASVAMNIAAFGERVHPVSRIRPRFPLRDRHDSNDLPPASMDNRRATDCPRIICNKIG